MNLYKIPRNTKIRVLGNINTPPAAPGITEGDVFTFGHMDGMYGLCKKENGEVVYLSAFSDVEIIKEG